MERRRSPRKLRIQVGILGFLLALVLAYKMHNSASQKGYEHVMGNAESKAGLIVELTNGFVGAYSSVKAESVKGDLPNPATFRAQALKHVQRNGSQKSLVSTDVIGLPGREIANVASDSSISRQILELEKRANSPESSRSNMLSSVYNEGGVAIHRSLWAFVASEQACADCHNQIQNLTGNDQWRVGDVMGAQLVEQNIDHQLMNANTTATVQSILLFFAVFAAWLCLIYLFMQLRLTQELKKLATTDPLTGCLNRREVQERISKLKGRTNGALLMLDLDKFKDINDAYGHDAGDQVILDFTQRIKDACRAEDWVARFGGEEFLVWLPGSSPIDAIRVAERLKEAAQNSEVVVQDNNIRYTVSIGMHVVQNAMPSRFENWIKAADELLYRAKMDGRNRIVCEVATV